MLPVNASDFFSRTTSSFLSSDQLPGLPPCIPDSAPGEPVTESLETERNPIRAMHPPFKELPPFAEVLRNDPVLARFAALYSDPLDPSWEPCLIPPSDRTDQDLPKIFPETLAP